MLGHVVVTRISGELIGESLLEAVWVAEVRCELFFLRTRFFRSKSGFKAMHIDDRKAEGRVPSRRSFPDQSKDGNKNA
jgi:hypothetical protein